MYDEDFIKSYLPTIDRLARKYENEHCSYDELYSEGQYILILYLHNNKNFTSDALYSSIKYKLKRMSEITPEKTIDINTIFYNYRSYIDTNFVKTILKNCLNDKEFDIITRKYGINSETQTLLDISKDYHISVERVRQIINRAIFKANRYLKTIDIACMNDVFYNG